MSDVAVRRSGRPVVSDVDWRVEPDERWVILGPNGSGKTTLVSLASAYNHPTSGTVDVLGCRLGRVDVRQLRRRIGLTSADLSKRLRPEISAIEVVMSGLHGALETWWHSYEPADRALAAALLAEAGVATLADHPYRTLSEGERQQVLLCRARMGSPELLLLDEPNAGLDLGARERLVGALSRLASDAATPATVLVTHHAEEIPPGFTHALLLRQGQVLQAGPLEETLTSAALSDCFGLALSVRRRGGRWSATAVEGGE